MSTCRHPTKIRHRTPGAAWAAIRELGKAGKGSPDMSVYPCDDHWHVGHDVVRFTRRIRQSLRRGR